MPKILQHAKNIAERKERKEKIEGKELKNLRKSEEPLVWILHKIMEILSFLEWLMFVSATSPIHHSVKACKTLKIPLNRFY